MRETGGIMLQRLLNRSIILVIACSILGCASGVKRDGEAGPATAAATAALKYSTVDLHLDAKAKALLPDNVKFNPDTLKGTIERLLKAKQLLAGDSDYRIEVEITDLRVRSHFAAVMFGFMAGSDSVTGNVYVLEKTGRRVHKYEVSVSYALGGLAGGQDETRMGWLYEEFARVAVNELTGEDGK